MGYHCAADLSRGKNCFLLSGELSVTLQFLVSQLLQNNACDNFIDTKKPAASFFPVQLDILSVKTNI